MYTINAFKEFLGFLRNPTFNYKREEPLSFLTVTLLFFIVFVVEMTLFAPVSTLLGIESMPHAMESVMNDYTYLQVFLLAVVAAPIAEEIMFRFHLRYKPLIWLFILILFGSICFSVSGQTSVDMSSGVEAVTNKLIQFAPFFAVMILIFLSYFSFSGIRNFVESIVNNAFALIFYITAAVFAGIHIFNFGSIDLEWYLAPLLVLPQFILALYLGYVRVRNNLLYSIYVHALNNSIPMLLLKLASSASGIQ